jgi:uncharacterized membrane protein YkvA (DUF1232 family)
VSGDLVPFRRDDEPIEVEVVAPDVVDRRSWPQVAGEAVLIAPNLIKLVYRLLRDRRVPVRRKVVVGLVMGYVASPVDLIPDAIPVLGQLDDALVVSLAVRTLVDSVGRETALEYWDGTEDTFDVVDALLAWGAGLVPAPISRLIER